ncbi:hypothetical protein V6N11_042282 [Hibiscus sabdariffa]|uniref:Uncharacterized protein n=1 Tax=Hibiscus sabdariffa TaxID=183260 RepID=A0ABR2QVV2_9ROSI
MSSAQSEFVITIVNASLSDSDISYIRKLYGHSNTCTVKGDKAKTVQVWQVKKPDLNGKSDNTDGKSDLTVNAEEQQSETGAKTRVSNPVDTIVEPITHCTQLLPELGISNPVRKSVKKDKKSGASTKKFEVLAKDADGKKTRAAAQGVTELLQDLKSKKKAHYDKALPEVHVSSGGDIICLMETRIRLANAAALTLNFSEDWNVSHNYSHAENGRLWILWWKHLLFSVLQQDKQTFSIHGKHRIITATYGSNNSTDR